jgi:hypothetical protein
MVMGIRFQGQAVVATTTAEYLAQKTEDHLISLGDQPEQPIVVIQESSPQHKYFCNRILTAEDAVDFNSRLEEAAGISPDSAVIDALVQYKKACLAKTHSEKTDISGQPIQRITDSLSDYGSDMRSIINQVVHQVKKRIKKDTPALPEAPKPTISFETHSINWDTAGAESKKSYMALLKERF